jgi:hypothetical protein
VLSITLNSNDCWALLGSHGIYSAPWKFDTGDTGLTPSGHDHESKKPLASASGAQLNSALDAIGMTPGARVRFSGSYKKNPVDPRSSDDID